MRPLFLLSGALTIGLVSALNSQTTLKVQVSGRVLAASYSDTTPSRNAEIRVPSLRYRTYTDSTGRFQFVLPFPSGCHSIYLAGHLYRLQVRSGAAVRIPTLVLPPPSMVDTPRALDTLGQCSPNTPEPPYNWPVWHAIIAGRIEYPSGEPRPGQLIVLRCAGVLPEPGVPIDQLTRPIVFATDSRPVTDSLGYFSARPVVYLDRAAWIQDVASVPCTGTIWAPPFDSIAIRVRFVADTIPVKPVAMNFVSDIVRYPTAKDLKNLPK